MPTTPDLTDTAPPDATNRLEIHPAMTRRCLHCGADPGTPCINMLDGSELPLLHVSRCQSSQEVASLREMLEQRFALFEAAGPIGDRR